MESRQNEYQIFEPTYLIPHIKELGNASETWYESYKLIEAAGIVAVKYLIPLIRSDNYLLRGRAIELLRKIGDETALEPLRKAAGVSEKEFRAIISAPDRFAAVDIDGISIPVEKLLAEYRQKAKDAFEAVNTRVNNAY